MPPLYILEILLVGFSIGTAFGSFVLRIYTVRKIELLQANIEERLQKAFDSGWQSRGESADPEFEALLRNMARDEMTPKKEGELP